MPDDPEANRALGRVQLDGRWVSEEESYGPGLRGVRGRVDDAGRAPGDHGGAKEQEAAADAALDAEIARAQAAAKREAREQAERDAYGTACRCSAIRSTGAAGWRTGLLAHACRLPNRRSPGPACRRGGDDESRDAMTARRRHFSARAPRRLLRRSRRRRPSPVDEVVDSNLAARGGKEKLQALHAIRETGTVTASDGRVAKVVREIERPGRFRLEFTSRGRRASSRTTARTAGRWRRSSVSSSPRRCRRRPTRPPGSTSATSRGRSSTGARRATTSSSSVARRCRRRGVQAQGGAHGRRHALRLRRRRVAPDRALGRHAIVRGHPIVLESTSRTSAKWAGSFSRTASRCRSRTGRRPCGSWSRGSRLRPALDEARFRLRLEVRGRRALQSKRLPARLTLRTSKVWRPTRRCGVHVSNEHRRRPARDLD